jgi:hypothetical protein
MDKYRMQIGFIAQFCRNVTRYKFFKEFEITFAFFIILISFNLIVPIGTGPDSGAHSVMTYCA